MIIAVESLKVIQKNPDRNTPNRDLPVINEGIIYLLTVRRDGNHTYYIIYYT